MPILFRYNIGPLEMILFSASRGIVNPSNCSAYNNFIAVFLVRGYNTPSLVN